MTHTRIVSRLSQAYAQMMRTNPPPIQRTPAGNIEEHIRASIDPRRKKGRLQPPGSREDTRLLDLRTGKSSLMEHGFFIDDDEILAVIIRPEEFNRAYPPGSKILYGRTPFMRAMVHQVGLDGCMAACSAMMCLDHRIVPDWSWVMECDLAQDEELMSELAHRGLLSSLYKLSNNHLEAGEQLEQLLTIYHAGVVTVDSGLAMVGDHVMVLDYFALHADLAVFREPFHGWCLATSAASLLNLNPASFLAVRAG